MIIQSRMLRRFRSEESGSIAIEAVIILPMLFWTFLALFSFFHAYRTYSINQKAAYTIADMISRETNPLDEDYLTGARSLLRYMTNAEDEDVSVRVTMVYYDAEDDQYHLDWSSKNGNVVPATATQVAEWKSSLPNLPDQERVIVVETFHDYDPPFATGLLNRNVANFVFTKPRYAPQVLWSGSV